MYKRDRSGARDHDSSGVARNIKARDNHNCGDDHHDDCRDHDNRS